MKIRLLLFMAVSALASSCYHAQNTPPDNGPVTYNIFSGYQSITDSAITVKVVNGDSSYLFLNFELISGNPANYPFTCFLSGLPAGITASPDSFNFRLNYNCRFKLHASNHSDSASSGSYPITLNMSSSLGLQTYPMLIKVLPR